jgi:hypothetical protein
VTNVLRRMEGSIFYVAGGPVLIEAFQCHRGSPGHELIEHQNAWGHLFEINGGAYDGNGMHRSLR